MRDRHAAYFLALAQRGEEGLQGPHQGLWLARLDLEHDNARAALCWTLDKGQADLTARLSAAMARFWWMRGYRGERRWWLEKTLASGGPLSPPVEAS